MTITISAFRASPDEGQGLARDMRVRWVLEEAGLPYDVELVTFEEMRQPAYTALQPFGQIPFFKEDGLVLFESGSIALHVAGRHAGLLPADPHARARAITWLFAALNTVEPPIVEREAIEYLEGDKPWFAERLAMVEDRVRARLKQLSDRLGDADWLDGDFSIGDLMMIMVLRRADGTGLVDAFANLAAYVQRGTARPAYQRAFADQLAVFADAQAVKAP